MHFFQSNNNLHLKYLPTIEKNLSKKPAVFFDRDGVLIKDCHYISKPEEVELEQGALEILNLSKSKDWLNIVVTNQSGISRGYSTWEEYKLVTARFLELIGDNLLIDGIYANGCLEDYKSNWRKPNTGMLEQAKIDLNIDIKNSILIGDRLTDIKAGARAGLKNLFHVLTGHGKKEREDLLSNNSLRSKNNIEYLTFVEENNNCKLFLIDSLIDLPKCFII